MSVTFSPTHSLFAPPTLPFKSSNSTNSSIFAIFSFKCQKHVIPGNGKSGSLRKGNRSPELKLKSSDQEMETQDSAETAEISVGLSSSSSPSTSLLSFLCPLLKLFSGGDPSSKRNYLLEEATSRLSTLARLPWGSRAQYGKLGSKDGTKVNPPMHLQIFEFEACPFCRRVREAMTELDLSAEIYPCPKGSVRHREMVRRLGGKEQFPFLVDPNTGTSLYESGDIVKYLFQQYDQGRNPSTGLLESTIITGWMPTLLRAGRGMTLWDRSRKEPPPKKLELFSYENNPVPYLVDPNTGTQIGDYKKIISYLFQTYSLDAL
ncbi:uncharacterized protein LOC107804049 isoform X2 [Nicotiana tabacum]|uniref:Uncharacterized protein LOC107804049 isoform X2 n=1 Tax=Nicotiana tabacum TaxID=4097 RepID=A0A1S4B3D5_TOBAC|nr:PREDICTED: uncharacterized protein LOC107804049 isoform X2 [Nicotiana tabacum]